MDERPEVEIAEQQETADTPAVEETSAEYLGRWHRLVSTTNWEKGRIICQWREALTESGAEPASFTDEAWSRRVGNVTPQHTGRLRRVFLRFGQTYEGFGGLYWSHFQGALDWSDAEMWLEGAVQNGWSVARMRDQRWEAIGGPADKKPREEDVIAAELDEDVDPAVEEAMPGEISGSFSEVRDADPVDFDESEMPPREVEEPIAGDRPDEPIAEPVVEPLRPFEMLGCLPPDLNEAFESFKLAILHHKLAGWREISLGDVLTVLDALKELATAPSES